MGMRMRESTDMARSPCPDSKSASVTFCVAVKFFSSEEKILSARAVASSHLAFFKYKSISSSAGSPPFSRSGTRSRISAACVVFPAVVNALALMISASRFVGLRQQKLFQQRYRFRLLVVFQVKFGELQEERPRLAHDPLLHIQVSQLFQRTNFFGGKFRDALVN